MVLTLQIIALIALAGALINTRNSDKASANAISIALDKWGNPVGLKKVVNLSAMHRRATLYWLYAAIIAVCLIVGSGLVIYRIAKGKGEFVDYSALTTFVLAAFNLKPLHRADFGALFSNWVKL